MKVEVDEITPVKKSLRVVIPQEIVSKAFTNAYADLNKKVKVPGFRSGKVPASLLEKKYGSSVKDDIIRQLIPDYYQKAIEETGIFPVEFPSFDKIEAKKDAPLSFTATVEVRPSITLSDYKNIVLPRKEIQVSDEDVEEALKIQQERHGQLEACPEDTPVSSNDYVIINFEGSIDGKPIKDGKNDGYTLEVGSNTFPPQFESSLLGKKGGDSIETDIPYPEDFQNKEIAGKSVHFRIDLKEVKKKKLPEIDDEFAKDLGQPNLSALKEHFKNLLLDQKKLQQEQEQKKVLVEKLISKHSFEVPSSLVAHELQTMMEYFKNQDLQGEKKESLQKELEPMAQNRVKEGLILNAIAEHEKVEVTDQDLETEMEAIAKRKGFPIQDLKQNFSKNEGAISGLKSQIREQKALDSVFSQARFEDVVEKGEKP